MNNYISKEQWMVIGANNTYNSFLTNPIMNFDSIKKLLDDHVLSEASKFISEVKTSTKLFRSRIVDFTQDADVLKKDGIHIDCSGNIHGYNEINSREPPFKTSSQGRCNIEHMGYLYVATNKETSCAEIKSPPRSIISIAEFELKKNMRIIDFSKDVNFGTNASMEYCIKNNGQMIALGPIFTKIRNSFSIPCQNSDTYLYTQIISDYIRSAGFDGIKYKSFYANGDNYVFFNTYHKYFDFIKSELIINYGIKSTFLDINARSEFFASSEEHSGGVTDHLYEKIRSKLK